MMIICIYIYIYAHIFMWVCQRVCVILRSWSISFPRFWQPIYDSWDEPPSGLKTSGYLVHTKILGTAGYLSHLLEHQIWMVLACFNPFPHRFIGFHWCVASMSDLGFAIVSTAHGWALELVVIRWAAPCSWCAWAHDNLQLRRPRHAGVLWTPGPV